MAASTIGTALAQARSRLNASGMAHAGLEARLLLADVLSVDAAVVIGHPERPLGDAEASRLEQRLCRRLRGEPLAYILGRREFWSLPLAVTAHTLVPRPESETLVELALSRFRDRSAVRILDLGTGSGCLLLALLTELHDAWGVGIDIDEQALRVARTNARSLGLEARAAFVRSDWAEAVAGEFDLVVANPPYISDNEWANLDAGVRDFEPPLALRGGPDGSGAYRRILPQLARLLAPDGMALLEMGGQSADGLPSLVTQAGFGNCEIKQDLIGQRRCLAITAGTIMRHKNFLGNQAVPV